jgi:polysaccharide chain length determinant protein (PEP-CTERM system associated)
MLPGKIYKPEDVLRILRKRIWVVLVPWAIVAATTAGVARKLPDIYESVAVIQVIPPQVPDNIVRATTTVRLEDRLSAIQQTILSRTKLEGIIQELNLYEKERKSGVIMQDIVENMRADIAVQPSKGDAFTVRYKGRNPTQVMTVTEKLAALFKTQSMKEGESRAQDTTSFVESQVDEAKRKLLDTEEKRKKYQLAHSGELPSQSAANMAAIQSSQMQLQSLAQSINNDQTTKQFLERQIADLENQTEPAGVATPVAGDTGTATQNLVAAKARLAALQASGVKPEHPDYKATLRLIRDFTQQVDAEALNKPVGAGGGLSREEQARQKRLADLREQLDQVKKNIDAKMSDEKKLRANAALYQSRVDMAPVRDAELVELNRDYATYSQIYNDLVAKKASSNMAVELATRQIGEQFTLVDAARLPQRPASPNRTVINLGGIFGGLALGLALVALIEYRDTTFKTDTELARVLALPVLAVVPLMKSDAERKAEFRKQLFLNVGLGSTVFLCLAVLAYSFVFVK